MSEQIATRSALLELREESEALREGHRFLDEKCLLLAGSMLRQWQHWQALLAASAPLQAAALRSLDAALGRHGLEALALYPLARDPLLARDPDPVRIDASTQRLLGLPLRSAALHWQRPQEADPLLRSPEAAACAEALGRWLALLTEMAAVGANLERLHHEYRRTARRARALDGVLIPESTHAIQEIAVSLEESEREDAIAMRPRGGPACN